MTCSPLQHFSSYQFASHSCSDTQLNRFEELHWYVIAYLHLFLLMSISPPPCQTRPQTTNPCKFKAISTCNQKAILHLWCNYKSAENQRLFWQNTTFAHFISTKYILKIDRMIYILDKYIIYDFKLYFFKTNISSLYTVKLLNIFHWTVCQSRLSNLNGFFTNFLHLKLCFQIVQFWLSSETAIRPLHQMSVLW